MKHKLPGILMAFGGVLIAAAVLLAVYNMRENTAAEENAVKVIPTMQALISGHSVIEPEAAASVDVSTATDAAAEMPTINIDGYDYIGYLSIPVLELTLPVMSTWDYERLKLAPCRQYGSIYSDDLVIAAHNYKSHFGMLETLEEGAVVYFTDAEGNVTAYTVGLVEKVMPDQVEYVKESDWELTLYTCTLGGQARIVARCARLR